MNKLSQRHRTELKQLGDHCRQVRLFSGYSQQEVAQEVGVHPTMVSNFENGQANNALIYRWYIYAEETYCKARFENSLKYFKRRSVPNDEKSDVCVREVPIDSSEGTQDEDIKNNSIN